MKPFLWGAATSAHQIDGQNEHSDWWHWEKQGQRQGRAHSGQATDHWNQFREDIRLAAELKLNSYRFSIEWARIEPQEGVWDETALGWYCELLTECERYGLLPMATLQHFTLPRWLAEQGGTSSSRFSILFTRYVEKVAQRMGARIPLWCTLNEPMVMVLGGYIGGFMPPATFSPDLASQASANLLSAHIQAYQLLHSKTLRRVGPWAQRPLQVGIAHNMIHFQPCRKWHPLELFLARVFHRFYNLSWLDALCGKKQHFGVLGFVPYPSQVHAARGKRWADFLGLNYYMKAMASWKPREKIEFQTDSLPFGLALKRGTDTCSDMGWAIHPQGLKEMLKILNSYPFPIYITENGIADEKDVLRPHFLKEHLLVIADALGDGADIRGYYHWSLLDNFEWSQGFGPRFGLYEVNYDDLSRRLRPSGAVYRNIIERHERNNPPNSQILRGIESP